ncbi:SDR family NAD(P)-dependent oxidoreductase [Ruania zhangjianzhongii]|uniref:SDR family NAD(P)-dependent oxidoreductase n=1 Tax=Ruania zhangjianzhongii TaxID=2603206 RepID=UPI00143D1F35|nr:SDR family oxidoreductase [Ruania zhangjianzhongii]
MSAAVSTGGTAVSAAGATDRTGGAAVPAPVAVITGGSAGIGLAVGARLHRLGYHVVSLARRPTDPGMPWQPAEEHEVDVADAGAVAAVADQVRETHSGVDALVTCAGMVTRGDLLATSSADLVRQVEVNLLGTMHSCRAFAPAVQQAGGAIVTTSSSIATNPQPSASAYAAAKGGVESFSRALALELAPVRVNVVRPSLVDTGIWVSGGLSTEDYAGLIVKRGAEYPLGRVGRPEDVAAAITFLLSAEAEWITGAVLPVDGGADLVGR